MILWPAVDIRGGRAVRLARGEFDAETVYDADPLDAAMRWVAGGARALHVVDLDGARSGAPVNVAHVERIAAASGVPVEVGGGLRDERAVGAVLAAGARRAVLGTAALAGDGLLERVLAAHGTERIVVSVDARRGKVATSGWTQQSDLPAEQALSELAERGARRFVYSSIERDGMLSGPDLGEVARVAGAVRGELTYSGGVASVPDLRALAGLGLPALTGVIVGTALFEGRMTVTEGQAALDDAG